MSLTLKSVVDVAKAANYLVPLVPPITTEQTSVSQTEKPQQVTSLTQCHKGSIFRWFKFTFKPPYTVASGNLLSAIWDTSHWTSFVKFGLKTA